eukprot:gene36951-45583_t
MHGGRQLALLALHLHRQRKRTIAKVIDQTTKEVLRQMPSPEAPPENGAPRTARRFFSHHAIIEAGRILNWPEYIVGLSSPGIGSNLDVQGIISKLMAVEAAPIATLDKKSASYLAKVTAFGTLSGALGTFQSSLSSLTSLASFQTLSTNSSNSDILTGTASSKAQPGSYKVDITQLAQAQTLASGGYKSTKSAIGLGGKTTINIQLGTVAGGTFGMSGTALPNTVVTGGITPGGLSINNTAIATDSSTRSAKQLADAINAKSTTTGVSASAAPTVTSATLFGGAGASNYGAVDTSGGGTYSLSVGGVEIAAQASGLLPGDAGTVDAAALDAVLGGSNSVTQALANANITVEGTAAGGDLRFTNADGSNISITEAVTGTVTGGINNAGTPNTGYNSTTTSSISLQSSNGSQITVGGSNPAAAGLTAGIGGSYQNATFTQDGSRSSGNIVIDSTNNTLSTMVKIRDDIGGGIGPHWVDKRLQPADKKKLQQGEDIARGILAAAGAKHVFRSWHFAAHLDQRTHLEADGHRVVGARDLHFLALGVDQLHLGADDLGSATALGVNHHQRRQTGHFIHLLGNGEAFFDVFELSLTGELALMVWSAFTVRVAP